MAINHSDFTKKLLEIQLDGRALPPKLVDDLVKLTRSGVIMEGGPLASAARADWRADAVLGGLKYLPSDSKRPPVYSSQDTDSAEPIPEATVQRDSGFKFGAGSERELTGVNADLIRVTRLALRYSLQDFTVYDGIRTLKEQQQYVKNGTSKTMQSKHLQGLAVDLVPWINGKPVWDWDGCYKIACAMDLAATELGLAHRITWGGAWDRKLSDFGGDPKAYADEVVAYRNRHPGPDFIDGPHFEILP